MSPELTLVLHGNLRYRLLWGMIEGRARYHHLEYPVSSKGNGQVKFITWGCTAHVIMIKCLAGTRKKGAGRTPGTKEWKSHSCTAVQGRHHFTGRMAESASPKRGTTWNSYPRARLHVHNSAVPVRTIDSTGVRVYSNDVRARARELSTVLST